MIQNIIMAKLIKLFGCGPFDNMRGYHIQNARRQGTCITHTLKTVFAMQHDRFLSHPLWPFILLFIHLVPMITRTDVDSRHIAFLYQLR